MKKMGRKTVLEAKGLTIKNFVDAYEAEGSLARAAKLLDVSSLTVAKYLDEANITRKSGPERGSTHIGPVKHTGCLANWVRDNPDIKLPMSIRQISQMTKCSIDEVKTYIYRRARDVKDKIIKMALHLEDGLILKDVVGTKIPTSAWASYTVKVNRFVHRVDITAYLKSGGIRNFSFPHEFIINAFRANRSLKAQKVQQEMMHIDLPDSKA